MKSFRVRKPGSELEGSAPPTYKRLDESMENVPAVVQRSE